MHARAAQSSDKHFPIWSFKGSWQSKVSKSLARTGLGRYSLLQMEIVKVFRYRSMNLRAKVCNFCGFAIKDRWVVLYCLAVACAAWTNQVAHRRGFDYCELLGTQGCVDNCCCLTRTQQRAQSTVEPRFLVGDVTNF